MAVEQRVATAGTLRPDAAFRSRVGMRAIPRGGPIGDRRTNFVLPHAPSIGPIACASAVSASMAAATSATALAPARPATARRVRSSSEAFGIDLQEGARLDRTPAHVPNASVKSRRLPSSRMQSACARISANAPRQGSLIPRGLSMPTHAMPVADSSAARRSRPARVSDAGPARISGRFAAVSCREDRRRVALADRGALRRKRAQRMTTAPSSTRGLEHVGGKAQVHRARPARSRDAHGARDIRSDRGGARAGPRRLGHGRRHLGLSHFLERAASLLVVRRMSGEEDDGRLGHQRGVERG